VTVGQEDAPEDADLAQERATLPADSVAGRYAVNDTMAGAARAAETTGTGSADGGQMTAGPAASTAPSSAVLNERVLAAGTTLRFALLVLLCVVSSVNLMPGVLDELFVSNHALNMQMACLLASGVDPASSHQTDFQNGVSNVRAFSACEAAYTPNLDWVWVITAVVLLVAVIGMYWFVTAWRGRRSRVVALEVVDAGGGIRLRLSGLLYAAGLVDRVPRFVVDPAKATPGAVVFGRGRDRTVCLHGGLVAVHEADEQRFRAVVLHELAHIRNKDVGVTYATVALWRVFLVFVLLPAAVVAARALYLGITVAPQAGFNLYNAHSAAVLPLIVVAAYLTRASVLRSREIYADLRAVRWGAGSAPWDAAPAGIQLRGWQRLRTEFMEAWRSHPRPALRRQSLTDPRALFALDATSMIITGFAADLVFDGSWILPRTTEVGQNLASTTEIGELLVAGLVIAIGGIAQWRAVVYAILNGRPVPAGWRTGLWLGLGVSIGELVGPGQELDGGWLPAAPEILLVLVAALVLLMAWIAQNAEWWIRSWRGRSLHPAMLLGLAAPWLVFASILYWWEKIGNQLINGWVYSTAGLLSGYGIPGLPPAHIGPSLVMCAVLGLLPGVDGAVGSLWWAMALLWLVPLSVVMTRPLTRRPIWLAKAQPARGAPLPRQLPDLRRIWGAGASGALVCCVAMAAVMAYVHPHVPWNLPGPYMFVRSYWPDLVICGATVLTAAVVAAATDAAWLLTALIAAGITSALSLVVVFALTSADGCLGPFSTLATKCGWLPGAAWDLVGPEVNYSLMLGVFAGGLAAFAGRGARLLWQWRHARTRLPATAPAAPAPEYLPLPEGRAAGLLGARVTAILLIAAAVAVTPPVILVYYRGGNITQAQATQMTASPSAPSPALAQLEVYSWTEVGGLDLVNNLTTAENTYHAAATAADKAVSDGEFAAALRKIDVSCGDLARVTQRAEGFFPVPDPSGQQIWSQTVTAYQRLTTACRNLATNQSTANGDAAGNADQQANNADLAILHWLASVGAITLGSSAPSTP
jgi:Zn-dependent protease with chaperone function